MDQSSVKQEIDLSAAAQPFNRYWQEGIGSCHAYLTLREDWRDHARLVQSEIGFRSVRTHGIFHDLVGIYNSPPEWGGVNRPRRFNFQNLDKIYDFWLSLGLKPYVELSFTPYALASGPETVFQYRANVTPPKDMVEWSALIHAFVTHLIERYGLNEVLTWYFEVWNEPDLRPWFFTGSQADYFELYTNTARTIKAIDPRIKVGGPATSRNLWVKDMVDYCAANNVPVDFISTHHYCADAALVMGEFTNEIIWRGQKAMHADVQRSVDAVRASALPHLPVHYTEWNVSPIHEDVFGKDSEFTAAFVLQTIRDLAGLPERYMLWAISDIFEESGPGEMPFSGKYGLVNMHGIKKPVFHAFRFLSRMYDQQLPSGESSIVTRSGDHIRLLSWNFNEVTKVDFTGGDYQLTEQAKAETICLNTTQGAYRVRGWRIDREHGNAYRAWQAMGNPQYLTTEQVEALKQKAEAVLFFDEVMDGSQGIVLEHVLPPCGVMYYELERLS